MSAKLIYKDVAPGADSDAAVSTSDTKSLCNPSLLPFDTVMPKIATLEPDMWLLGGGYEILNSQDIPFWSSAMSDENGDFTSPPAIEIGFDERYTTLGVSLRFSPDTGDYCTSVDIEWYQGTTLLASESFAPTGTAYFCANTVTAFDRVVISLNATNKPYRYARLGQILFGVVREFGPDEFSSVNILQEIDLLSSEVAVDTLSWTLRSKSDVEYIFQLKQPVEAYKGSNLVGVFYITGAKRTAARIYEITCQDALGVLDGYDFTAAMYSSYDVVTLLNDIAGGEFTLDIDASFAGATVTGLIPDGTKRTAFQQVLFAIGAVCSTAGSGGIRVLPEPDSSASEIPDGRIYVGGSVETEAIVTVVKVTAHTYTAGSGSTGDDVIEVGGVKYVHTTAVTTISNPNVTATDKQNVISVEDATLVNTSNVSVVAQRVFDYYLRRDTLSERIVVEGERPGDYVSSSTPWSAELTGDIVSMSLVLSNTTVADIKIKAVSS
ncbi:MAG: hypothetical protein VB064_04810 [Oscillospiraceae bacterium]|nr:hypothetical protein [Oscillospiraceae bacterium]